jgi:hypothetical protein
MTTPNVSFQAHHRPSERLCPGYLLLGHDWPHGTRLHDTVEAVKPLSPPQDSWAWNYGLFCRVISGSLPMEDLMCWEMDYRFFAEKKAQENRIKEEQRAGVIDKLLSEANKQRESTNATPVKEVTPVK